MRITPLDIQQKQFSSRFRGFDMEEVDSFLELIREEMEELLRENSNLREESRRCEKQLKEYKNIETTLKDTLISTQQMAEQFRSTAKKDADLLRKEAEMKSEGLVRDAQNKIVKIHEDITDLKGVRRHFKEELKRLIESHLSMMNFDKEREDEIPDEV